MNNWQSQNAYYWHNMTLEELRKHLAEGADVNEENKRGSTPFDNAVEFNHNSEFIIEMLQAGAKVNDVTLFRAVEFNTNATIVDLILLEGVNVNARDHIGHTPLYAAAHNKHEVIAALLKAGAKVNVRDEYGQTPLHRAAECNESPEVIKVLLDAGADINAQTTEGQTPLHNAAVENENPEIIMLLLKAGADGKIKNDTGKTPFEWSKQNEERKGTDAYWALNDAQYELPVKQTAQKKLKQ